MPYSIRTARLLFFEIAVSEATFPDMVINTTIDTVSAIPIEMVIPNIIPRAIRFIDNVNSITITTPGQGTLPTTSANRTGLVYFPDLKVSYVYCFFYFFLSICKCRV